MSNNIDVQYDVNDHCVTAYATNSNGDQSRSTSWLFSNGGNVGICKANAAKNAIAGLPKTPTQTASTSQNHVVTNNTVVNNNYTTSVPSSEFKDSNYGHTKPYASSVSYAIANFTDGFPNEAFAAVNFSYFLTLNEKKEWIEWLARQNSEKQNELVHILHGMWVTDKANNQSEPKPTTPAPDFTQWKYPEGGVKGVEAVPDFGTFMEDMMRRNSQSTPPQSQRKVIPNPVTPQRQTYQPTRQPATKKVSAYENYAGIIKFGSLVVYGIGLFGSFGSWVALLNFAFFGTIGLVIALAVAECLPRE